MNPCISKGGRGSGSFSWEILTDRLVGLSFRLHISLVSGLASVSLKTAFGLLFVKGLQLGGRQEWLPGCVTSICRAVRWLCRLGSHFCPPGDQVQGHRIQFWHFNEVNTLEEIHEEATGSQVWGGCLGLTLCSAYQRAG